MPALKDLEVGAMFWAGRDPLARIKAMGVRCGQLGIGGDVDLTGAAAQWKADLEREDFTLVTVFCAYNGESYADIPTVQQTVGFIPPATRVDREARTREVSDFAAAIGVKSIACHIGFVPEDAADPDYAAVREMVRRICDHAAAHGQTFALETGQEPAHVLMHFLKDVDRDNIGINFDPANMILYGTGDPIEALGILAPKVISVHAKDGDWPPKDAPGALGTERPLGQGSVGMERFVAKLKEIGYKGPLNIEREAENLEERYADMEMAVRLLRGLA
ncbi:MAG: sugar phosphate isomerase/epimerase family protein [Bryobacteraceae bacterium]|nr:sugar phosphate isomerase/epimerase family protein [Bryobacteraceae bacterium]